MHPESDTVQRNDLSEISNATSAPAAPTETCKVGERKFYFNKLLNQTARGYLSVKLDRSE